MSKVTNTGDTVSKIKAKHMMPSESKDMSIEFIRAAINLDVKNKALAA